MTKEKIFKQWIKERDEAVSTLDITVFKKFYKRWEHKGLYGPELPSDDVLEIVINKMACNITSISDEVKETAAKWLTERGYSTEIS